LDDLFVQLIDKLCQLKFIYTETTLNIKANSEGAKPKKGKKPKKIYKYYKKISYIKN